MRGAVLVVLLVATLLTGLAGWIKSGPPWLKPVVVHYPAYCFPGGPWAVPGATMVHPCRTDLIVEI